MTKNTCVSRGFKFAYFLSLLILNNVNSRIEKIDKYGIFCKIFVDLQRRIFGNSNDFLM